MLKFGREGFSSAITSALTARSSPSSASPSLQALDVSNFDQKYTLEAPVLSPLRRPLSAEAEGQFEALSLAYISPETRDSMRHSLQSIASSVRPSGTRDSRLSTQSRDSTSSNDSRR